MVLWALYFFPLDPLFYVRGLHTVNLDHRADHPFFLMGKLEPGGWPHYLLVAWFVKTPVPTLLLFAAALFVFARRRRASRCR